MNNIRASLKQLIVSEHTEGSGTEADPARAVVYVIDPDGTLVARVDKWEDDMALSFRGWARSLSTLMRRKISGDTFSEEDDRAARYACDLIEKHT